MHVRHVRELAALIVAATSLIGCAAQPGSTGGGSAPPAGAPTASAEVVPVSLEPTAPASPRETAAVAPSALAVECTDSGTTVATDSVDVQPDGVHFQVHSVAEGRAFQVDEIGADNAPTDGVLVWALPPGMIRIWCGPNDPTDSDWVDIHVVDPRGTYVPVTLACASATHGSLDYGEGARGEQGDPAVIAKRHLRGLRSGDVVEAAGFPAAVERKVRVTRGRNVIAVGTYMPDAADGWLLGGTDVCGDSGISWGS